ncbi:WhiB family transcriptional regulator [Streptomyces cavourensis]|uniref:WhiB family transcriptional regulator n=1 Tax=Streptomyces cavourensis TaxID=67258 RepID=A0ABY5FIX2_9ACTN|nr:WhiB family transcriptional regulator [Streptomyces cavourensis]UTR83689.1 WhiB family transcriptional regulator [Streptomyces cavourensis]
MRTNRMTPAQARRTRRAVLQAVVDAGSRCAGLDAGAWFRGDDEPAIDWRPRRDSAIRVCTGCPVRAACEELALRNGDGEPDADELVRAGLTGPELAAVREHQAERLAAAADLDRDTEGRRLDDLLAQLHHEATKDPDHKAGTTRTIAACQTAQNTKVQALATQIRKIRTARRARTGWEKAA